MIFMVVLLPIVLIWGYYFSSGAWLNVESCMAILQTNPAEAGNYVQDYFSLSGMIGIAILFAFEFSSIYYLKKIKMKPCSKKLRILLTIIVILNIAMLYRTRENMVLNIFYDTKAYANSYNSFVQAKTEREQNIAQLIGNVKQGDDGVYVLVIGESETRDHMSCYGYNRNTTPWMSSMLEDKNFIQFNRAWSCANDTVSALTYALTNKNQYNNISLNEAVSIIDVANAAGYDTVWLSNQVQYGFADTPITAIAAEAKQQIFIHDRVGSMKDGRYLDLPDYFDEKLIPQLQDLKPTSKMLIVIHLMGSHYSYKVRYPAEYNIYDDTTAENQDINCYDNTIIYTDYVLKELFAALTEWPNFKAMLYFSDHGEGIDAHVGHDSNKYTPQMTRIPMWIYLSNQYKNQHEEKSIQMINSSNKTFTNDLIFNTMLDIMNVDIGRLAEPDNMILNTKYNDDFSRFKTSYGRRPLSDE